MRAARACKNASMAEPVVIVGAGLAGLCCARRLHAAGVPVVVVEASDGVGGRVRTDEVGGYRLDRGFQVYLTAYPEGRAVLDAEALDLRAFYPGALVWCEGKFHRVADPWKKPMDAAAAFLSPVASIADKVRVGLLRQRIVYGSLESLWTRPEKPTIEVLHEAGFSPVMIDRFFRAFFGGVFFDRGLRTSSRMFEFTFRMFNSGRVCVPALGMGKIPEQVAAGLPAGSIRLNARAESAGSGRVGLAGGEELGASAVVVATESHAAVSLLRAGGVDPTPARINTRWVSTLTAYFAADEAPVGEGVLLLDGEGTGPVNHACVPSVVSPGLAPAGKHLVSLSMASMPTMHEDQWMGEALAQMRRWFGAGVEGWRHLRTYAIPHALPEQSPPALEPARRSVVVAPGVFVCGDHRADASINGAMESGRLAAEAVLSGL